MHSLLDLIQIYEIEKRSLITSLDLDLDFLESSFSVVDLLTAAVFLMRWDCGQSDVTNVMVLRVAVVCQTVHARRSLGQSDSVLTDETDDCCTAGVLVCLQGAATRV